ncbi:MAG: hypothetical protein AAGA54_09290 [Myxococcota bacterium]
MLAWLRMTAFVATGLLLASCDDPPAGGAGDEGTGTSTSGGATTASSDTNPSTTAGPATTTSTSTTVDPSDGDSSSTTDEPATTTGPEPTTTTSTTDPGTTGVPMDCGNGVAEGEEECDGKDVGDFTCDQFGFVTGTLLCNEICQLEFDNCQAYECGDGEVERIEVCDGDNLVGQTCQTLGFDSGTLACDADCEGFETAGCGTCGNDVIDGAEVCEAADLAGETCITQGFTGGTLGCANDCGGFDTSNCTTCGDSLIEGAEMCDGANLDGENCNSLGFDAGTLGCDANCEFDTAGCFDNTDCCLENGSAECEVPEVTECVCMQDAFCCAVTWDDLCVEQAVEDCGAQCSLCGNSNIEDDEVCDNNSFGGATCSSLGFDNGSLSCINDCGTISTANCGICGDGAIDPAEDCDGGNLGGASCVSLGFDGGTLSCSANCGSLDTSGCISVPSWADDIQPIWDDNCGCHGFAPEIAFVDPSVSYANTVNVFSAGGGLDYIEPGNADASYIVERIEGVGGLMPPGGSLTPGEIALIREWIDAGAPNN